MDDQTYRQHCLELLARFADRLEAEAERSAPADPLRELAAGFTAVATGDGLYDKGPTLVARLFAACPEIAPLFPRDLLWFIGGDCLHYMPDEEQDVFQKLDELRVEAAAREEILDYHREKSRLLKMQ